MDRSYGRPPGVTSDFMHVVVFIGWDNDSWHVERGVNKSPCIISFYNELRILINCINRVRAKACTANSTHGWILIGSKIVLVELYIND
jgi:hypothetical protein